MYAPNVGRVLSMLADDAVVVDIGGWACPFNRADYVIDAEPFDTRGYYRTFGGAPSQGGAVERFSRDRWIVRDLCEHTPYPFADKAVDFVICSHTLEDVRDPLWVCAEMMRIANAGYIEGEFPAHAQIAHVRAEPRAPRRENPCGAIIPGGACGGNPLNVRGCDLDEPIRARAPWIC